MYAVTSKPFVRRTRATLRSAELGFLGVVVYTRVQTPRFWGFPLSAGALSFAGTALRPFAINWLMVGIALGSNGAAPGLGETGKFSGQRTLGQGGHRHHAGGGVPRRVGDADLPRGHSQPVGDLLAFPPEGDLRLPRRQPAHVDVGPGDSPGPAGTKRLHHRLLDRESPGEELDPERPG